MSAPRLSIERGDITQVKVDAIVNAANPKMLGGGGVDGAIHRAAGPGLLEGCRRVPKVEGVRCRFGEARITPGFDLPSPWVIHTVGPIYRRTPEPEAVLHRAYEACMQIAVERGFVSLAFPAISLGAYGFPLGLGAEIAVASVGGRTWGAVEEVRFVLFTAPVYEAFAAALSQRDSVREGDASPPSGDSTP